MASKMFCFQCQETARNQGCTVKGVCGKESHVANMMDLLIYELKLISTITVALREKGVEYDSKKVDRFITECLFSTITNANFDYDSIKERVTKAQTIKRELLEVAEKGGIKFDNLEELKKEFDPSEYDEVATKVGVLATENEDVRSLSELTIYGLKGMAAYAEHAARLGFVDEEVDRFVQKALASVHSGKLSVDELVALVLETGSHGVKVMALLDKANTETYGNPEMTTVNIGVGKRPGILISGHDLKDMEMLLEQTKDSGVDVYTHSEMLPANYYPKFKKYDHFHGNYGNAWWKQREEFETFNGPVIFTTNCIVPPLPKATYKDRIFTTNAAGYPGFKHIPEDKNGHKDFSEVIEMAKGCEPPTEIESGTIVGGFAHHQVISLADKVVEGIKSGAIRKFFVMGGCDGRVKKRNYYTEFAEALPKDTIILTAGCAKYRYNKLPLGDINGIPRVLDAGQCNDSYSLAVIALKLKEVFELEDINDLPIEFNIAWYEQKAVIVLLALLSLGIKNIHLGPTLPAFLSPNVVNVLVENFGIAGITDVEEDLEELLA